MPFNPPDTGTNEVWGDFNGLTTLCLRHGSLGHWCGYVGVPSGHPLHGKGYDDIHSTAEIDVHGGLTYAGDHAPTKESDGTWWFGFDCAHSGDLVPGMRSGFSVGDTYKDVEFVKAECERLAEQLWKLS